MKEQIGWRGFVRNLRIEAPNYSTLLPQLPRLLHQRLQESPAVEIATALREMAAQQKQYNKLLMIVALLLSGISVGLLYRYLFL